MNIKKNEETSHAWKDIEAGKRQALADNTDLTHMEG